MTSNINVNHKVTLKSILNKNNIVKACKQVRSNKGASGIDKMSVDDLAEDKQGYKILLERIEDVKMGKYKPLPVRRVYIPKDNGEKRPLGVPTVVDRVIQQAIANELSRVYEPIFSNSSFGFRPNKSAKEAIIQAYYHITDGYLYIIDMDLAKFFDTVNHSKLIQVLQNKVKDHRVISLIHKILRAKIFDKGKAITSTIGTPQGGPISPILANILLNELDHELEARGHKFVRYADDMIIFCKTERAAYRTYKSITKFIENKLLLKVNKEKTKVGRINWNYKFLGYAFHTQVKEDRIICKVRIHKKSINKCKARIRELLDRRVPGGEFRVKNKFNKFTRGWFNYYKLHFYSSGTAAFNNLDRIIRRRIRVLYWKMWKTPEQRKRMLEKHGNYSITAFSTNQYQKIGIALNKVLKNDVIENTYKWFTFRKLIAGLR